MMKKAANPPLVVGRRPPRSIFSGAWTSGRDDAFMMQPMIRHTAHTDENANLASANQFSGRHQHPDKYAVAHCNTDRQSYRNGHANRDADPHPRRNLC